MPPEPPETLKDRHGDDIHEGDWVTTRYPRGSRQGEVDSMAKDRGEADRQGVAHPPSVIFRDRHGHLVANNPHTLEKR